MIAILTSDFIDLENLLPREYNPQCQLVNGLKVYHICVNGKRAIIVNVGESKVYVTRNVMTIIDCFHPDLLINTGNLAGLNGIAFNSIFISTNTLQHDVDVTALGFTAGEIPELTQTQFPANAGLIGYANNAVQRLGLASSSGTIGSGDQFIASTTRANALRTQFNIDAIDMESATIGEIAQLEDLDYVTIKGISNNADDNAVNDYYAYKATANSSALTVVLEMLKEIFPPRPSRVC